uniref:MULE transposase domain-containing protein n=1 Tax=Trichuris muris TaxID=70415 RepID=A0A5S6QG92_TRIMR
MDAIPLESKLAQLSLLYDDVLTKPWRRPANVLNQVYQDLPVAVAGQLPSHDSLRLIIQRRRRRRQAAPSEPDSAASLVIPPEYQTYGNGEQFLLFGSGVGDSSRILIYGRCSYGSWRAHMTTLFADGTFNFAPRLFAQVYVLLTEREGLVLPILAIQEMWPSFSPPSISMDFEKAAMNAAAATFPGVEIWGCFFHLVRNMKKQLFEEHLMTIYDSDPDFALAAKKIVSLAFVPPEHLDTAAELLWRQLPQELEPIMDWFERTYLGRWNRSGGRRPARFPSQVWSAYQRTLVGSDSDKQLVEAAHR